jgi:phenylacetate-coenzyme A ligase PaaK-like adenylate-forming protein
MAEAGGLKMHKETEFEKKSEDLLNTALQTVPFYRDNWKQYDPGENLPIGERFAAMPVLTKADMRGSFPNGLVPEGTDVDRGLCDNEIEYTFTSGTTGDKVINLWNQTWWHASEMSSWQLNPHLKKLSYPPRQATLASSLNVGISCEEDLPMDHRIMGNLLYLNEKANIICWKESHLRRMAAEINEYRPTVLEANPSLLSRCCWYWLDHGIEVSSPDVITFTYELPSEVSLSAIRRVFHSPLVSSYGSTETGFVMDTDEAGLCLQNPEYCRIDFFPLKEQYGGPCLGRIAVSTFGNPWAYIVRFDVGDLVRVKENSPGNFIAETIEGRASSCTFGTRGNLVTTTMADRALAQIPGIRDYDLVQNTENTYELSLKGEFAGREMQTVRTAKDILSDLYGSGGSFEVHMVKDLLPGPAGKYRRTHTRFEYDDWALCRNAPEHTR